MIDISVRDLTKAFEVNNNILDGLTFQVQHGERVGTTSHEDSSVCRKP